MKSTLEELTKYFEMLVRAGVAGKVMKDGEWAYYLNEFEDLSPRARKNVITLGLAHRYPELAN
jgi:hypothetical protein